MSHALMMGRASAWPGILIGAVLFFYLYGVNFTFAPTYTSRIIVLAGTAYLLLLACRYRTIPVDRGLLLIGALYGAHLIWLLLVSVIVGPSDLVFLAGSINIALHAMVGGIFFALLLRARECDVRGLILLVQVVISVQAALILLYFVNAGFREWTFLYIPEGGNIDHREVLYRSRGMTHSSGATLSVVQSFGVLFTGYLLATCRLRSAEFWYLLLSFALLLISVALTGRTGLLVLPVVLAYLAAVAIFRRGVSTSMLAFASLLPVALVCAYFGLMIGYQSLIGEGASGEAFELLVSWVIGGFFDDGRFESRTVQILQSHWFLPADSRTFWLGDLSTWLENRTPSDVGYVRVLFASGFVGAAIYYALFAAVFATMALQSETAPQRLLFAVWGGFLFAVEAKEPFLNNLRVNVFIVLMLVGVSLLRTPRTVVPSVLAGRRAGGHSISDS